MSRPPWTLRDAGQYSTGSVCAFLAVLVLLGPALGASGLPGQDPVPPSPLTVAVKSRALSPGELAVLTVDSLAPVSAVRVTAFGRSVDAFAVGARTWRAVIGIDLDVPPGEHSVLVVATGGNLRYELSSPITVQVKAFPTRQLTVAPRYVDPPAQDIPRIQQEAQLLERLWLSSPSFLWSDTFQPPVREAANSAFGSRSVFNGQERNPHGGADFPSPDGTPVRAPGAGRVVFAGDMYFTGGTVVVDHGAGIVSLFAHLSVISVKPDGFVEQGDRVGLVGATGRVTGPHLHWTVRAHGARVDPLSLLAVLGSEALSQP